MNVSSIALPVDLVIAPRCAWRRLRDGGPVAGLWLGLGLANASLLLSQTLVVAPLVRSAPEAGVDPEGAERTLWMLRGLVAGLAPVALAVRAGALAAVVSALGALCGRDAPFRRLFALALVLETVFWLETLATTVGLWLRQPASLAELAASDPAGCLALVWRPPGDLAGRLFESVTVFTLWWAILLGAGLVAVARFDRRSATAIAAAGFAVVVGLRLCAASVT